MNRKISLALAGITMTGALAGCGQLHSLTDPAATSSAVKSEAAQAGKAALSTCIPAKDITQAYLISLAEKPASAKALAKKCDIPEGKRIAFARAVLISAGNAYFKGTFKTVKGRAVWADQAFPVILKTYQKS